ncbi:hypothetical protein BMF94_2724 [Rhodotorula taiwanensis]|uniref:Uncharacterized protein n=1 Tax=Rhodotorula taiwanensis TaxID=741276 RepID=A0A2S5BBY1_9BASI|nr:hypothetical protein BMF94_2724 [Rhodotorula taiwanensis]
MEHRSLVWPVHKQVCGPGKAFPFEMPPLKDDEFKALEFLLDLLEFPRPAGAADSAQPRAVSHVSLRHKCFSKEVPTLLLLHALGRSQYVPNINAVAGAVRAQMGHALTMMLALGQKTVPVFDDLCIAAAVLTCIEGKSETTAAATVTEKHIATSMHRALLTSNATRTLPMPGLKPFFLPPLSDADIADAWSALLSEALRPLTFSSHSDVDAWIASLTLTLRAFHRFATWHDYDDKSRRISSVRVIMLCDV